MLTLFTLSSLPLICGLLAACVVLLVILVVVICYFCRGCWMYRRRKRLQNGRNIDQFFNIQYNRHLEISVLGTREGEKN